MEEPIFENLSKVQRGPSYIRKHFPEFYDKISAGPGRGFAEQYYMYRHHMTDIPKCKVCGGDVAFKCDSLGHSTYCSARCKSLDWELNSQISDSNQKKYRDHKDEILNKKKKTNLDRYGFEEANQSPEIKSKIKQTNIHRYGCSCTVHNEDIQEKSKQTCLRRYGVANVFQSEAVQKKCRETMISKYGGVGGSSSIIRNKMADRYKESFLQTHPDIIDVHYGGSQKQTIYVCRCPHPDCNGCSDKTFQIDSILYWVRKNNPGELCTRLRPVATVSEESSIELMITQWLDEANISYEKHNRSILEGRELDIYIPNHNIAIECNGIYWHSSFHKDSRYHHSKYKDCHDKGIQLLTIWEDWMMTNPNLVKSLIYSKCSIYKEKIYARECVVGMVSPSEARDFLTNNHIQGPCDSKYRYGLYHAGKLVSLMTFGSKRICMGNRSTNGYELVRFCSLQNIIVVGGASKLLSHFQRDHHGDIISFASHDISNGMLYERLGFEKDSESTSSYWYIDQKFRRYHRYHFTKHKLVEMGYDKEKSESAIMEELGYFKIYDTGQSKYIKKSIGT